MLIKHGDGKVLSVVKSSELDEIEEGEVTDAAVKKLKKADAKLTNIKLGNKKENKNG